MSLVYMEGFDGYTSAGDVFLSDAEKAMCGFIGTGFVRNVIITQETPHGLGSALRVCYPSGFAKNFPKPLTRAIVGFAQALDISASVPWFSLGYWDGGAYTYYAPPGSSFFTLFNCGDNLDCVGVQITDKRGQVVATYIGDVPALKHNTWQYIEICYLADHSDGYFSVRVDGAMAISKAGVRTLSDDIFPKLHVITYKNWVTNQIVGTVTINTYDGTWTSTGEGGYLTFGTSATSGTTDPNQPIGGGFGGISGGLSGGGGSSGGGFAGVGGNTGAIEAPLVSSVYVDPPPQITTFYFTGRGYGNGSLIVDDLYALEDDGVSPSEPLGECVVYPLTPAADVGPNQMSATGPVASHADALKVAGGTSVQLYGQPGSTELFSIAAPEELLHVYGVGVAVAGVGGGANVQPFLQVGSDTFNFDAISPGSDKFAKLQAVDPNKHTWSRDDLLNLKVGVSVS